MPDNDSNFMFDNGDEVRIRISGEQGTIEARADYRNGSENQYYLHYKASDGRAVFGWFDSSKIEKV